MHTKKRFNPNNRNRRFEGASTTNHTPKPTHVLPSPGILESYEELVPGASKIILEMAKMEQEHRHKLDQDHLKVMAAIAKRGQLFGIVFAIVNIYICAQLVMDSNSLMAIILAVISFIGLGLVSTSRRKFNFRRNPSNRHQYRK